ASVVRQERHPDPPASGGSTLGGVTTDPSAAPDPAPAPPRGTGTLGAVGPLERRKLPHDVADQLLDLIAASSGSEIALPAERTLCEQLGVSPNGLRGELAPPGP